MDGSTAPAGAHPTDHLHDVPYIAAVLDRSQDGVYRLIRSGKLKAYRLGHRTLRISDAQLQEYLDAHQYEVAI
jgi:excisionase family DNA binding protein